MDLSVTSELSQVWGDSVRVTKIWDEGHGFYLFRSQTIGVSQVRSCWVSRCPPSFWYAKNVMFIEVRAVTTFFSGTLMTMITSRAWNPRCPKWFNSFLVPRTRYVIIYALTFSHNVHIGGSWLKEWLNSGSTMTKYPLCCLAYCRQKVVQSPLNGCVGTRDVLQSPCSRFSIHEFSDKYSVTFRVRAGKEFKGKGASVAFLARVSGPWHAWDISITKPSIWPL